MFIEYKTEGSSDIINTNSMKFCTQIIHGKAHGKSNFVAKVTLSTPGPRMVFLKQLYNANC